MPLARSQVGFGHSWHWSSRTLGQTEIMDPQSICEHYHFDPPNSYYRAVQIGLARPFTDDNCPIIPLWNLEWLTLEEIQNWKFPNFQCPILQGLIPFARDYSGDPYCWQTDVQSHLGEQRIILCDHDDGLAWNFAPSIWGMVYRSVLTRAASPTQDGVEEMQSLIHTTISTLVSEMPKNWIARLATIAKHEPRIFRGQAVTKYSLLTPNEQQEEVTTAFGSDYTRKDIQWAHARA